MTGQSGTGPAGVMARVFLHGAVVALAALVLGLEGPPNADGDLYSDFGYAERFQDLALVLIIVCFGWTAVIDPPDRGLALVCAGLAGTALIRESDYLFDMAFDGLWQMLAGVMLAATLATALRFRAQLREAIRHWTAQPAFGLMLSGFLTVFVFSRLYGQDSKWARIMTDSYERSVKNFAEEGVELLGYTLILLGALEILIASLRQTRTDRA